ncbi:2-hydroxy-3-oxopropionate reductase [Paenibacillus sp. FSL R7-269]|nr:2-hydroxy-3-oxopropionate reductase [Paenibacillus sp. FSL R7-269]
MFQAGFNHGYGDEDLYAVVKSYEDWIGRKIGGSGDKE